MTKLLQPGHLELPEGGEQELRVSIKAPPAIPIPNRSKGKLAAAAATHLVYTRQLSQRSIEEEVELVVHKAKSQSSCTVQQPSSYSFSDGADGVSVKVSIQVGSSTPLCQLHVLRMDASVLTHFVLTGSENDFAASEGAWMDRINGFRI